MNYYNPKEDIKLQKLLELSEQRNKAMNDFIRSNKRFRKREKQASADKNKNKLKS
ncbi:MAG: hypothetical protein RSD67_07150 [Oscillospiraceae bacterium]